MQSYQFYCEICGPGYFPETNRASGTSLMQVEHQVASGTGVEVRSRVNEEYPLVAV